MKKVLLTGASGFVGRQCLSALASRGFKIDGVWSAHQINTPSDVKIEWHRADLLDSRHVTELMKRIEPTHLLHAAWYAVPGKYWDAAENYQWVDASRHLLQTFARFGGQRAVGVGSCAEYDWSYGHHEETSTPLAPATTYGNCKLETGKFFEAFGLQQGLPTAWGRLFFLYGPHEDQTRLVASVVTALLGDNLALCSAGHQIRDFLHVEDAASALVALLDSEVTGPVNIASGKGASVRDLVTEIARQLAKPELLRLGALPLRSGEPEQLVADVRRLHDEVRWSPRFDLSAGVKATIEWWRQQLGKS